MDLFRHQNVYDIGARRKLGSGRRPPRTAPSESPVSTTAWYHGDAIEASRTATVEVRRNLFSIVPPHL